MLKVVVHIGLPKTGTTTLQEALFSTFPGIAYIGQTNILESKTSKLILKTLLTNQSSDDAKNVLLKIEENTNKLIISDEALTFGEFMLRGSKWNLKTDHATNAARIRNIVGKAEIIIILRNQGDWLESWYKQGLKTGKYISQAFNDWLFKELGDNKREHLFSLLDYESLYNAYASIFGRENIHVFFYEDYSSEYHKLARHIAEIIDIDADQAEKLVLNKTQNVTGNKYKSAPVCLKVFSKTKYGKKIAGFSPMATRIIRNMLSFKQSYPEVAIQEKKSVMLRFYENNRRLLTQLNRTCEKYISD